MIREHRVMEIGTVLLITFVAILLRIYHIDRLAVFLSDQAIDSFAVKNFISGSLTLLGPRASVGQFFNGPIVYYLMVPFYILFRNDPLAGTFFQITLQIATIPFLYALARRFGGVRAGILSIIVFTLSPLLISYSRAAFNSYPSIFFTTVILYVITASRPTNISLFVAGICTGMLVQMHYFLFLYAAGYFIYVCLQSKSMKKCVSFLTGAFLGLSPFLLFELRHNFFNIRTILFSKSTDVGNTGILDRIGDMGTAIGSIVGIPLSFLGIVFLLLVCFHLLLKNVDRRLKSIFIISLFVMFVCAVFYKGVLQTHYIIGFMMIFVVIVSIILARLLSSRVLALMTVVYLSCLFTFHSSLFRIPREQDGIGIMDQRHVASFILNQVKNRENQVSWNVTQDAQQDNRAMPIRYLLFLDTLLQPPLSFEDYQSNKELFVIVPNGKKMEDIHTWEVQSFGHDYDVITHSLINDRYSVVYLRKRTL